MIKHWNIGSKVVEFGVGLEDYSSLLHFYLTFEQVSFHFMRLNFQFGVYDREEDDGPCGNTCEGCECR